jgi:pantoate--beta-alanine ligase
MYLSGEEREEAPTLYRVLQGIAGDMLLGHLNVVQLEKQAMDDLCRRGWKPDQSPSEESAT